METILLFAPLVGALIAGFGHGIIGDKVAQVLTTSLLFLSALLSWVVFLTFDGHTESIQILRWIESGTLAADWAIRMDRLTTIMLIVITTVSALVHLYSIGYMAHDEHFREGESYRPPDKARKFPVKNQSPQHGLPQRPLSPPRPRFACGYKSRSKGRMPLQPLPTQKIVAASYLRSPASAWRR